VVGAEPGTFHTAVRGIFQKAIGQQKVAAYDGLIEEESRHLVEILHNFEGKPWHLVHSYVFIVKSSLANTSR
jgi:hypothetical protein